MWCCFSQLIIIDLYVSTFLFSLYTEDRVINASLSLKEHYNRPTDLLLNYMDQLVRGLSTQNTQKVDMLFTKTVGFKSKFSISQRDF